MGQDKGQEGAKIETGAGNRQRTDQRHKSYGENKCRTEMGQCRTSAVRWGQIDMKMDTVRRLQRKTDRGSPIMPLPDLSRAACTTPSHPPVFDLT